MEDQTTANPYAEERVAAALAHVNTPTPSLAEYRRRESEDDNTFWRLESGDHMNLLEEALDRIDALEAEFAKVHAFIDARREFVGVLRQYSSEDMGDYMKWTGHAEARRELAETLGLELDSKSGGLAARTEGDPR